MVLKNQWLKLARKLVRTNLHNQHSVEYQQAIESEIYLLEGEYKLIIEKNTMDGIEACLKGLKVALWLGLNRRIIDNLYPILRCAERLGHITVKSKLQEILTFFWKVDKEEAKKELNYLKNQTAENVIELLWDIRQEQENPNWAKIAPSFQDTAAEIWHQGYREASGDKNGKHPLGVKIEDGTFLEPIKR